MNVVASSFLDDWKWNAANMNKKKIAEEKKKRGCRHYIFLRESAGN
jgi:hypothetical protein